MSLGRLIIGGFIEIVLFLRGGKLDTFNERTVVVGL